MPESEFELAYRTHFAAVWRTVRRLGIAEKDAVDATQEAFLIAYRRRDEFERRSSVRTWLIGIAVRVAAGRRNRAGAQREQLDEGRVAAARLDFDFGAALEARDFLRLLDAVLDELSFEQRAVFTMFEMEGMSGDEIAEATGVPVGTVRSRLRLAREAFAQAVKGLRIEFTAGELSGDFA
jgi:RNA polymerase sigma-70 factor (ECF subfamily)